MCSLSLISYLKAERFADPLVPSDVLWTHSQWCGAGLCGSVNQDLFRASRSSSVCVLGFDFQLKAVKLQQHVQQLALAQIYTPMLGASVAAPLEFCTSSALPSATQFLLFSQLLDIPWLKPVGAFLCSENLGGTKSLRAERGRVSLTLNEYSAGILSVAARSDSYPAGHWPPKASFLPHKGDEYGLGFL